jgi:outer membrane protein assembly factor BamA
MDNEGHPIDFLGGNTLVNGTIEFRVPLLRRGWGGLWLGFFLDWGGLAVRLSDFNAESMRVTAGFGARLHVGNIPIRFDLGFNLDRRCNPPVDGLSVVDATNRCTNGREGLTDTQVALLYSF